MKNYIITFLMVLTTNFVHASTISGSASELKTQNPVHFQEHFKYKNMMRNFKLKNKVDIGERIFLSIQGGGWVCGEVYQYNTDTNSIEFLYDEISGVVKNKKCKIPKNSTIRVFYRKEGEIKALRDMYGSNVSVATLDYLNS